MMYYDRKGRPICLMEMALLSKGDDYRRVAGDWIGEVRISTVWLGIDHQYGEGPPLIFETMIFGGDRDGDCYRYATEAEAIEGHRQTVAQMEATEGVKRGRHN